MKALDLFRSRKLSLGKAAELAGMSKPSFREILAKEGVSVMNHSPRELEGELEALESI